MDRSLWDRALFTSPPIRYDGPFYERGWLSGMADGDGSFWTLRFRGGYRRFRLALTDEELLLRAKTYAQRAGFDLRSGQHAHRGFGGGRRQTMSCLWLTNDAEAMRLEGWLGTDVDSPAWFAGYLAGIIDAEGSFSRGIFRISQYHHSRSRPRIETAFRRLAVSHTVEKDAYYIHRARGQAWRVLSMTRPAKRSILRGPIGHHPHALRAITSVEPSNRVEPVVDITTTTGSFVAGGFVVKNCDTPYTWDWKRFDPRKETLRLDVDTVCRKVEELAGDAIRSVVLTGGEPMLQWQPLCELAGRLRHEGFRIEVETNGTIEPPPEMARVVDQWNVSPKTESSGNTQSARERARALAWFADAPNAYWKFVITAPTDIPEVTELVARYAVPKERVFLMPEGIDAETLMERSTWLTEICEETGFRLGTRLQVLLWGAARGR